MILSVIELKSYVDVKSMTDTQIEAKLRGLEKAIHNETNNNFQNRKKRFTAPSDDKSILCTNPYFAVGDTIEISQSINDGLYVITSIENNIMLLDKPIYPADSNLITKVEYDDDVKMGVVDIMKWEDKMRDKMGVASETISRHSVSYFSQDASNTLMGYPKALLGFLEPYYRARF